MKKIGIITFHASHNYGSMLQAYALQQTICDMDYDCEIINFRQPKQKRLYRPFFLDGYLHSVLKALRFPRIALDDIKKHRLFERFLQTRLTLTKTEFKDSEQLHGIGDDYYAYISGSDQIWNLACTDHDPAYFLNFVSGPLKIAYAPSMGPHPEVQTNKDSEPMLKKHLSTYNHLSVRENESADRIEQITSIRPTVCLDPTLLLPAAFWKNLATDRPIIKGDYILLYAPSLLISAYDKALKIAEQHKIPVVVTTPNYYLRYRKSKFMRFHSGVGPVEFLNLVRFSKFVVCDSFHGVVFSMMFSRPFYAVNGMNDSRISNLLTKTGLEKFAEYPQSVDLDYNEHLFSDAREKIQPQIDKSLKFLRDALS